MSVVTVDAVDNPNLRLRIDTFSVPEASRPEFLAAMRRSMAFLRELPGCRGALAFEKVAGPTAFQIVTMAAWESPEAMEAAGERVRAHYRSIGFDPAATMARLGVRAEMGAFRAPAELQ
jgi:hypothetical protein